MEKGKKLNKLKISIVIGLIVLLISTAVFGRYIYNAIREAYFTAKQFYFSSDILTVNGADYTYQNWGGVSVYEITFDLYSFNNELSKLNYDLNYTVTCESLTASKVTCSLDEDEIVTSQPGTIYKSQNNTSTITVYVTPIVDINRGEEVEVKVTAKTKVPYKKEISAVFTIQVNTNNGDTYSIEDVANRDYAVLKLLNTKESASEVTLEFDPEELRLDLNDECYTNAKEVGTNSDGYVNKIVFDIAAEAAKNIKFYKVDKSLNYTYPGALATCPIDVII